MVKKQVNLAKIIALVKEMVESKTIAVNVGPIEYKGKEYSIGIDLKEERG